MFEIKYFLNYQVAYWLYKKKLLRRKYKKEAFIYIFTFLTKSKGNQNIRNRYIHIFGLFLNKTRLKKQIMCLNVCSLNNE
jgi:hypothetical protein